MSIELKIKAKSLAAEAGIIRMEERKLANRGSELWYYYRTWAAANPEPEHSRDPESRYKKWRDEYYLRWTPACNNDRTNTSIMLHRKGIVAIEARHTHLARGFMKGMAYRRMEDERTKSVPDVDRIAKMVWKYMPWQVRQQNKWYNVETVTEQVENWLNAHNLAEKSEPVASDGVVPSEIAA